MQRVSDKRYGGGSEQESPASTGLLTPRVEHVGYDTQHLVNAGLVLTSMSIPFLMILLTATTTTRPGTATLSITTTEPFQRI